MTGPYGAFALPDPAPRSGSVPVSASPLRRLAGGPWCAVVNNAPAPPLLQCAPSCRGRPYHGRLAELCRRVGIDYRLHLESERGRLDLAALGERQHTPVWFCGPEPMATLDAHLATRCTGSCFAFADGPAGADQPSAAPFSRCRAQAGRQTTRLSKRGTLGAGWGAVWYRRERWRRTTSSYSHSQHLASLTALRVNMTEFRYDRHAHEEYSFGVTLAGRQNFFCHGGPTPARQAASSSSIPGMFTTAMPGTTPASTTPCSTFPPHELTPLFADAAGERAMGTYRLLQPLVRDEALSACILELAQAVRGQADSIEQEFALYRLATRVMQQAGRFEPNGRVSRIDRLCCRPGTLSTPTSSRISPGRHQRGGQHLKYHFLRLFRQQLGITPSMRDQLPHQCHPARPGRRRVGAGSGVPLRFHRSQSPQPSLQAHLWHDPHPIQRQPDPLSPRNTP